MKLFVFIVQLFESSTKDLFIILLYLMSFFSAILRITVQILFLSALPSVSQSQNSLKKSWMYSCLQLNICYCCLIIKLCLTLCDPMDCNQLGFSVHGISQAKMLEWVAISLSRGSVKPKDQAWVSFIGRKILYYRTTREYKNQYS